MAPVILFDGVCNLCHAAVGWVLARDRGARFRFASLQSAAAQGVIAQAGLRPTELPDSLVLVDQVGVHVRSEAALRIARELGAPWSFAALARLLPRGWRDAVYDLIARHRYRWFGRQQHCLLPSPAVAARFLDADEPIRGGEPTGVATPATPPIDAAGVAVPALPLALAIGYAYLVVHLFPFPLDWVAPLPFIGPGLLEPYTAFWHRVVQWVASRVFGVDASTLPNGSGDTTYNYVEVAVDVACAVGLGMLWWWWARRRPTDAQGRVTWWRAPHPWLRVALRFYLGGVLLSYGWHKLIPIQFPTPGPDRLLSPFGDASPMGLLWTFMGASPAYQMVTGFVEVLAGGLLLWRRTTLLGALLATVAMVQVVALNFCYDVPVKLYSSHLLLLALVLLVPDLPRLLAFLLHVVPVHPAPLDEGRPTSRRGQQLARVTHAVAVLYLAVFPAYQNVRYWQEDQMLAPHPLQGVHDVVRFTPPPGTPDSASIPWTRFALNSSYRRLAVQRADGSVRRYRYETDSLTQAITATFDAERLVIVIDTTDVRGARLSLRTTAGDAAIVLRPAASAPTLLLSRGFHWVNEFPYNR